MKKGIFSKLLPHLIALVVFLVVACIYCRPALEGKVLSQSDVTHWKGSIHQSEIYKESHGKYPLWTNALFSGMPTFQIGYPANNNIPWVAHNILTVGLPVPIQFFFLACICFYFLAIVLRVNPYLGIMGALAFAYATYNPVIISVGHNTKMWSIAYMPAFLGSFLLIYNRKYWLGGAFAALFTSILIAMNHLQITYYIFLVLGIATLFYFIHWVLTKQWKHLLKCSGFGLVAIVVGVLTNAVTLFTTYDYQKETIRGGSGALTDSSRKNKSKTGLDKDYAFSYSMEMSEPFVMLIPRMFGGSSDKEEVSQDNSKAAEAMAGMPQQLQQQLPLTYYWGGLAETGGTTSGPPYVGAIMCFLAILGMFLLDRTQKWWMFTAIVLAIVMSWGSFFEGFNSILYNHLPFYNKFRAPSMTLVIPQLLIPLMGILTFDKIIRTQDRKSLLPNIKKGLIATAAIFVVLFLLYFSFDYLSKLDKSVLTQVKQMNQPELTESVKGFFNGLASDRKTLMIDDILRALLFIAIAGACIYLIIKNTLRPVTAIIILTVFTFVDLISVDSKYLNGENYKDADETQANFVKSPADEQILKDTGFYRVFDMTGDPFQENFTSYYYNSVGGYHPAKLRIYQDLIEKQLMKQQPNMPVFNMLNTRYFIQKDRQGVTQKYQKNDSALGNCWFVNNINFVRDANQEMAALDHFNPKDTAVVQESFRPLIQGNFQPDNNSVITLVKNDNDVIRYNSRSATNQFAVFSEIYYASGWKAFIDNKETPIAKVDYVLRGLSVPAGQHNIEFRFEPSSYITGSRLTTIFSIVLLLLLAVGIFFEWRSYQTTRANTAGNTKRNES